MSNIQTDINEQGSGEFFIEQNDERVAKMVVQVADGKLTVSHTEVDDALQGQGIAGDMLTTMVDYARAHSLHVIPTCSYVKSQFTRHPEQYADVWKKDD